MIHSVERRRMNVEIISGSISMKVWDLAGIELATPGSAVRYASVARHVTNCTTPPGPSLKKHSDQWLLCLLFWQAFCEIQPWKSMFLFENKKRKVFEILEHLPYRMIYNIKQAKKNYRTIHKNKSQHLQNIENYKVTLSLQPCNVELYGLCKGGNFNIHI